MISKKKKRKEKPKVLYGFHFIGIMIEFKKG